MEPSHSFVLVGWSKGCHVSATTDGREDFVCEIASAPCLSDLPSVAFKACLTYEDVKLDDLVS